MYKRVLLKLSGESLAGKEKAGISPEILEEYIEQIIEMTDKGVQIAIVIGGGNFFRGLKGTKVGFDRVKGDYMGMLATTMNGLALQSEIEAFDKKAKLLTAFSVEAVGERYTADKAIAALNTGEIVIICGGTGNPFFTTDTAAALRAVEIKADILLKGTRVDGIYTADPEKDKTATKFDKLTFDEVYEKDLNIMDLTAFTLCKENKLPIYVFNMDKKGSLKKVIQGKEIGTLVTN